jgi:hypothetical protein
MEGFAIEAGLPAGPSDVDAVPQVTPARAAPGASTNCSCFGANATVGI